ncbi:MAG: ATP-binding cassette domain-containing protein, partial [Gammaproteobacteria bacterium]|nr:ATP-binding cassette domain-containing protein [Gammaproteobacteria bacterium]
MNLLRVDKLCAGYASSQVLFGVDLLIDDGEIVTLLGRNGMGKSTLIKAIMGMLTPTAGSVSVQGQTVNGQPSFKV